jgi:hypothetical protein
VGYARKLADGQVSRVHVVEAATGASRIVHVDHGILLEAPNWTIGGDLILNGDGVLWRIPATGSAPLAAVDLDALPELNNDHVLAPDGETIFVSANDGHIYAASLRTGAVARVTVTDARHWHFLHGMSPDGARLAYVALDPAAGWSTGRLRTVRTDGSDDLPLTEGAGPDDGPEYSPDGEWIYFNTERFSRTLGHAQIARVRPDGSGLRQLTFDDDVNWFPHLDPTGRRAVYLAFPPGTQGHPADLPVRLLLVDGAMEPRAWTRAVEVARMQGGQGTINVNSWSPDGTHFAYVDYPAALPAQ